MGMWVPARCLGELPRSHHRPTALVDPWGAQGIWGGSEVSLGSAKLAGQKPTPSSFLPHCDWGPGGPHWVQAFRHVSMELQRLLPGAVVGEGSIVVALQGAPD